MAVACGAGLGTAGAWVSHHEQRYGPLDAPADDIQFVTVDNLEATPDAPADPASGWPPTDEQVVEIAMADLTAMASGRPRPKPAMTAPPPAGPRTHTRRRGRRRKPRLPRPRRRNTRWLIHIALYLPAFSLTAGSGASLTWIGWNNRNTLLQVGLALIGLAATSLILLLHQIAGRCACLDKPPETPRG